jgi:hypothetical protein
MMVFWQERLAILATPKTASTAIEAALGGLAAVVIQRPRALKHTNAARFASFWKPYLAQAAGAEFEVAALMRHPRDWLGSWYRDGQRDDVEQDRSTRGMSFDDFVQAYCAPGPRPSYADVGSQAEFLGATGPARVDRLFRYEDLSGFLEFLEDRLGCEILLPRLNVSPLGNTSLSAATEARLREVCVADFALYAGLARA